MWTKGAIPREINSRFPLCAIYESFVPERVLRDEIKRNDGGLSRAREEPRILTRPIKRGAHSAKLG